MACGQAGQVSAPGELTFLVTEGRRTMKRNKQGNTEPGKKTTGVCAPQSLTGVLETQEVDIMS